MSRVKNPPAFACAAPGIGLQEGMDLRDWFAGLAMQARLSHAEPCFEESWASTANWAYEMADAMLEERMEYVE